MTPGRINGLASCWLRGVGSHQQGSVVVGACWGKGGAVSALLSVADPTPKVPHHQHISKKEAVVPCCLSLSISESCIVSIHVQVLHSRRKLWLTARSSLAAVHVTIVTICLSHQPHTPPILWYLAIAITQGKHFIKTHQSFQQRPKPPSRWRRRHTRMVRIGNAHLSLQEGYYTSKTSLGLHSI